MTAAGGRVASHEVTVRKLVSSRLGGSIFAGTLAGPAKSDEIRVVAAGNVMRGVEPTPGDAWLVVGAWKEDQRFGQQFHAARAYLIHPAGRKLAYFLAGRSPRIGQRFAERLQAALRGKLADALDGGDLLALSAALALRSPSRSVRLAADILETWQAAKAETALRCWLDGKGMDGFNLAGPALAALGHAARAALEANPYSLAGLVKSWPKLESFAWDLLSTDASAGPRRDRRRLVGAVDFTMKELIAADGGTAFGDDVLRAGVARCLRLTPASAAVRDALRFAEAERAILPLPSGTWRPQGCAMLEDGLAKRFASMANGSEPSVIQVPDAAAVDAILDSAPHAVRMLDAVHRATVLRCLQAPLAALAGTVGSAKADVLGAVGFAWEALGGRFEACAASGQASALLSRSVAREALTLGELLASAEQDPEDEGEDGPPPRGRPLDARTLLVVDDASTVPLGLWHRLVRAMRPGCRLLMAGDPDQPPPLGFGLVFHVLAHDGRTSAQLSPAGRKPRPGSLPAVAAAFSESRVPPMEAFRGPMDGAFLEPCSRSDLPAVTAQVVAALGGFGADHAVQVVAPGARGISGADDLNARFHAAHREANGTDLPSPSGDVEVRVVRGYQGCWFAAGEPVVAVRNDYRRGVFLGALGRVEAVRVDLQVVAARFGRRLVEFGPEEMAGLRHAWCLDGGRIQACSPDRMVVALYDDPEALDASWIYTAVGRATKQVVFVGDVAALSSALRRPPAWRARRVGFGLGTPGR